MPPEPPITAEAEIIETLDDHTYRATLPNGKIVHAHSPRRSLRTEPFREGEIVSLELNPYDFSRARIRSDSPSTQEPRINTSDP